MDFIFELSPEEKENYDLVSSLTEGLRRVAKERSISNERISEALGLDEERVWSWMRGTL